MNYCPNCGNSVESTWNVCANCGYSLSREGRPIKTHQKPETQVKEVVTTATKGSYAYFKPKNTYGPFALIFGIIGVGLSIVTIILRIYPLLTFTPNALVINNLFIVIMGVLAVIFGFIGAFKDDSRGMAVAGLILGAAVFILIFYRFILYMRSSIIPVPPP